MRIKNLAQKQIPTNKFGKWSVLRIDPNNKYNFLCECACKIVKSVSKSNLVLGKSKSCFDCSYESGSNHDDWSGHQDISGSWWSHLLNHAKRLNKRCSPQKLNITLAFVWRLYIRQNKQCALSGLPIEFIRQSYNKNYKRQTASLDRIDSNQHYVIKNVQLVHKEIQNMKMNKNQDYFIRLCQLIAKHQTEPVISTSNADIIKISVDLPKFGEWTVLGPDVNRKHYLICQCSCGEKHSVYKSNLKCGYSTACRRCSLKGDKFPTWSGYRKINSAHWCQIKRSAQDRNLLLNVTIEQIWDQYIKQNGRCALTGLPIHFAESNTRFQAGDRTASLDRIDSSKGYFIDNIQWIHKDIQDMKSNKLESRFIELCRAVANHQA